MGVDRPAWARHRGKLCQHRQMATSPLLARSSTTRRVSRARRRGDAVGDLRDRRQGQATQGPGPRRRRLRSRRARLPDAGVDRRGGRRCLSRPAQPPVHADGGPARAAGGESRPRRHATRALRDQPPAGARHQRRQACGLQRLRDPARPGRRGARPDARTGRPIPRRSASPAGVPVEVPTGSASGFKVTVDQLEEAATDRTKVLLFVSPSNPTGAVYRPRRDRARSGVSPPSGAGG